MGASMPTTNLALRQSEGVKVDEPAFRAFVKYEDDYVQPLIISALNELFPTWFRLDEPLKEHDPDRQFLQISSYETINHDRLFRQPMEFMANSYIIRKALIRKEYLASCVAQWAAKNPDATLSSCFPETISLQLDYAEFLDDALIEGDGVTLMPVMAKNAGVDPADRSWWLVKGSMADRGNAIAMFSTFEELQTIFEDWEEWEPSEEEEDEDDASVPTKSIAKLSTTSEDDGAGGMTSSLRHFVLQRYIEPLLLPEEDCRKFHIRCYVVAVGALKTFVYREMLALFSTSTYEKPSEEANEIDLKKHLTNTCLQNGTREGSVERFWDLPDLPARPGWKGQIFDSICEATGQLFQAAQASPVDFQPLPNAFELYGVDWLVGFHPANDGSIRPWLLEVNAFPDLKQTGDELKDIIGGLWRGIATAAVAPFFKASVHGGRTPEDFGMVKVLDVDMHR